jgi:alanine racemase
MNECRIWAEVDASAIRHNAGYVLNHISRGAGLMAVVKADAYGHGVEHAVPALREVASLFAVANVAEAAEVARLAPGKEIALLSPCLAGERRQAVEAGYVATVSSAAEAQAFAGFARPGQPARIQLKVDTGMGRIGAWHESALGEIAAILELDGVEFFAAATHLPVADEDEDFTRDELGRFADFAREVRRMAPGAKIHALNSAGICDFPEYGFDFVRAGLMLYGSASIPSYQPELRPALAWKTRVLLVREVPAGRGVSYGRTFITPHPMRIATLAVGYADGYPRQVSGRGAQVLIGGMKCPVLGRVTMDQILVDVSAVPDAAEGDEAVLVGSQGSESILAADLAEWAGTIAWDIFTGIGGRTRRVAV